VPVAREQQRRGRAHGRRAGLRREAAGLGKGKGKGKGWLWWLVVSGCRTGVRSVVGG
jgi:hypothetical protein